MSVSFCGLELANPIINGSGTFDAIAARAVFGEELLSPFPFSAYVSKTITLAPRDGNPPPRLWEAAGGLVNSIGLPNKGLAAYMQSDLAALTQILGAARPVRDPGSGGSDGGRGDGGGSGSDGARGTGGASGDDGARGEGVPLITNVMGASGEELAELVEACAERREIAALELNVSCPNVRTGLDIGADPQTLGEVVADLRGRTAKPLIVKLTPNTADVAECARAAESAGADAVSLINTLRAMALDPTRDPGSARPWLGGAGGGLSGPAVRAVAVAQVAAVAARVAIPVVGMGGVQTSAHARELLDVGARLVAVGTESFRDPCVGARIAAELGSPRAP